MLLLELKVSWLYIFEHWQVYFTLRVSFLKIFAGNRCLWIVLREDRHFFSLNCYGFTIFISLKGLILILWIGSENFIFHSLIHSKKHLTSDSINHFYICLNLGGDRGLIDRFKIALKALHIVSLVTWPHWRKITW